MKVRGLPHRVSECGAGGADCGKSSSKGAAICCELVDRWRRAMEKGVSAAEATQAVGAAGQSPAGSALLN